LKVSLRFIELVHMAHDALIGHRRDVAFKQAEANPRRLPR
jgi:hypothetical protein